LQSLIILHLSETQQQRQHSQHDPEYRPGTEMREKQKRKVLPILEQQKEDGTW
jgi:hypothetical protein